MERRQLPREGDQRMSETATNRMTVRKYGPDLWELRFTGLPNTWAIPELGCGDGRGERMDPDEGDRMTENACTDCTDGEHHLCAGGAWDQDTGAPTVCACYDHGHEGDA